MRIFLVTIATLLANIVHAQEPSQKTYFYVGTYTAHLSEIDRKKNGISLWFVDHDTGALKREYDPWRARNGSFVVLGQDKKHLYSVNELGMYKGERTGYLTQYRIDSSNRALKDPVTIASSGSGPAYLSTDISGDHLLLANYGAGNIVVYPISPEGSLSDATANVQHTGTSIDPRRQEAPHPHSIVPSPDNTTLFVPDLGLDKIKAYTFDALKGSLTPKPESDVTAPPGSGPRHLTFHPDGNLAFCSLEMSSQVAVYNYKDGRLTQIGIYSTLPEDFQGNSSTAEVRVSPNGKNVYVSNRGHDSIAVFSINKAKRTLKRIQFVPTQGKTPRNFALDASGTFMIVANQVSNSLVSFRVDTETGMLTPTGQSATIPAPTYICMY